MAFWSYRPTALSGPRQGLYKQSAAHICTASNGCIPQHSPIWTCWESLEAGRASRLLTLGIPLLMFSHQDLFQFLPPGLPSGCEVCQYPTLQCWLPQPIRSRRPACPHLPRARGGDQGPNDLRHGVGALVVLHCGQKGTLSPQGMEGHEWTICTVWHCNVLGVEQRWRVSHPRQQAPATGQRCSWPEPKIQRKCNHESALQFSVGEGQRGKMFYCYMQLERSIAKPIHLYEPLQQPRAISSAFLHLGHNAANRAA